MCVLRGCVGEWFDVGGSVGARAWMWVFLFFFFKFEFYYWDLSFSLKSDIDVTVQSHLKMFELCATTRVMCLRHPTPIVHVWDVGSPVPLLRLRFVL